jgi:hypothetical protein
MKREFENFWAKLAETAVSLIKIEGSSTVLSTKGREIL